MEVFLEVCWVQGGARILQDLWRGTQGMEELLELLVGNFLVGVGDVVPVLVM